MTIRQVLVRAALALGVLVTAQAAHAGDDHPWYEFPWWDNPTASKQEVCRVYQTNFTKVYEQAQGLHCGFTGGDWDNPSSAFATCMGMETGVAQKGPGAEVAQVANCGACRDAQAKLAAQVIKAGDWQCLAPTGEEAAYVLGFYTMSGTITMGGMIAEDGFQKYCNKGGVAYATFYIEGAKMYERLTNQCIYQKKYRNPNSSAVAGLAALHDRSRWLTLARKIVSSSSQTSFALPAPSDGSVDVTLWNVNLARLRAPNTVFEVCGTKLGKCDAGSATTAFALASSSDQVKSSIVWSGGAYASLAPSSSTSAALATPSTPIVPKKVEPVRVLPKQSDEPKGKSKSNVAAKHRDDAVVPKGKLTVHPPERNGKALAKSVATKPAKTAKASRPPSGGLLDDDGPSGAGRPASGGGGGANGGGHRWRP